MATFNPERLLLARRRRALSMSELASAAGVTTRILSDHVGGKKTPTPDTIRRYAEALGFPEQFFSRAGVLELRTESVSFRSMKSLAARNRDAALAACQIALELNGWIEQRFRLPEPNIPDLRGVAPEEAAMMVRTEWRLGNLSVKNMIHIMELNGVRVFSLSERTRELDAFSFWQGKTPFCFLNTQKSAEHSRFDAAHELGHLVMHRHGAGRQDERDADAFASAFLMPSDTVRANLPLSPTIGELLEKRQAWGTSLAALTRRAHAVGLLSPWQYRTHCIEIGQRGYRTREPAPVLAHESSQVLHKVFAALRGEGITKTQIANELSVSAEDLEALVFGLVLFAVGNDGTTPPKRTPSSTGLRLVK